VSKCEQVNRVVQSEQVWGKCAEFTEVKCRGRWGGYHQSEQSVRTSGTRVVRVNRIYKCSQIIAGGICGW
jgi:hypothetical protein